MVVAINEGAGDTTLSPMCFSRRHGCLVRLTDDARTAERLQPLQEFNNGVVLTDQPLVFDQPLEFRLDRVVNKWCGSLELGLSQYSAEALSMPSTMTSVGRGTVVLSGRSLLVDGKCVCRRYCRVGLDRLKVGDTAGVVCRRSGAVHFLINGEDQGVATSVSWTQVWAFVDIYGSATQVSFVESNYVDLPILGNPQTSDLTLPSDENQSVRSSSDQSPLISSVTSQISALTSSVYDTRANIVSGSESPLVFHHLHGRNVCLSEDRRVASRRNADAEFNHGVLLSSRPLHDNELFQVEVCRTADRWTGSVELGVSACPPERLQFPHTMTAMREGTCMLSGSSIIKDGVVVNSRYACDLDSAGIGCRVGVARLTDGSLHFYRDGVDQGVACMYVTAGVYAVCDLYGQCVQVSLLPATLLPSSPGPALTTRSTRTRRRGHIPPGISSDEATSRMAGLKVSAASCHSLRFSSVCGTSVRVQGGGTCAVVVGAGGEPPTPITPFSLPPSPGTNCLLFSSSVFSAGFIFEIQVDHVVDYLAGCICIGMTCLSPESLIPPEGNSQVAFPDHISLIDQDTWWFQDSCLYSRGGKLLLSGYCSSLSRLKQQDRIALIRSADGLSISLAVNSRRFRPCRLPLPPNLWLVVQLSDRVRAVSVVTDKTQSRHLWSTLPTNSLSLSPPPCCSGNNSAKDRDERDHVTSLPRSLPEFHTLHGESIVLECGGSRAGRVSGYNHGLVLSSHPLQAGQMFEVCVDRICDGEDQWSGSLAAGIVWAEASDNQLKTSRSVYTKLPASALSVHGDIWCAVGETLYFNGVKAASLCMDLDQIGSNSHVAVSVDSQCNIHVYVDGADIIASPVSVWPTDLHTLSEPHCFAIFDVYGQCVQISACASNNIHEKKMSHPNDSTQHSKRC